MIGATDEISGEDLTGESRVKAGVKSVGDGVRMAAFGQAGKFGTEMKSAAGLILHMEFTG
jgi:hypothetical protein